MSAHCKAALNIAGIHYDCETKGDHDIHGNTKIHAIWGGSEEATAQAITEEGLQAQVDKLRTHVSAWSYPARESLDRVTRAIGRSIDGLNFEHSRSFYGKPGRITVEGRTADDGKEWYVELVIVRVNEVDSDGDRETTS